MPSPTTIFSSVFLQIIIVVMLILSISIEGEGIATEDHSVYASISPSSDSSTATLPDFNFAAAGDWGCTSHTTDTVNNIVDKNPELVLGLGDYSYDEYSADCWFDIIQPIDNIMKIAIGNHDNEFLRQYMSHFNLTNQYYSFNYQNVHFTVMSTELPFGVSSKQYNFVHNDLSKAASDPNIDWIMVYYHRLAYTSPAKHTAQPLLQNMYHPLFDKYDVDLVLQGHNHNYQRSYPIKYNTTNVLSSSKTITTTPIITDTNNTNYINPEGQIFVTVGTGGKYDSSHKLKGQAFYIAIQHLGFGFLNVDIINNGTTLSAKFYENVDGIVKDQFTITK
jgi:Calcineurin-like phosphoesterase